MSDWEKEVKEIADYLGCNKNELWSEISKLLRDKVEGMEMVNVQLLAGGGKKHLPLSPSQKIYNNALKDILKEIK